MQQYILRRLALLTLSLFGVSILVFVLVRVIPGDTIDMILGTMLVPDEQRAALRAYCGLDKPVHVQYWDWLILALRGNLGYSIRGGQPVLDEILSRLPVTVELTIAGVLLGVVFGIPMGTISALKPDSIWDWCARICGLLGLSTPRFWLGTLLILILSRYLRWLPSSGHFVDIFRNPVENLKQVFLPAVTLGVSLASSVMRMTRSSMLEVLRQDFVRTAHSKGLHPRVVLSRHCLKNVLIPVITIVGMQVGYLLGGTVIVEQIFALPGVGRLALYAINQRDYTTVQGTVLFMAFAFAIINLIVDVVYCLIDPRIRYE